MGMIRLADAPLDERCQPRSVARFDLRAVSIRLHDRPARIIR